MDHYPILEFDPAREAIISPYRADLDGRLPTRAVLCFFQEVLSELAAGEKMVKIGELKSEIGTNPIYELSWRGERILVMHPGVGAPLCAGFLEELIGSGVKSFIVCGGCGVLDHEIVAGHPVILTSAVRDEGTSYHYLPPFREVFPSAQAVGALKQVLEAHKLKYLMGKSWTTDALYRETAARRETRMKEGCVVVEMEASALFAVAEFRKVTLGQVVYGGDLVVPEGWDEREWNLRSSDREMLFWLSVEASSLLSA